MSKTTQNRKGPQRVRPCKNSFAIEEAKLVFDATWEAVMSASDEELDSVLAAIDASKPARWGRSSISLAITRAARENSGTTFFGAVSKGPDACKLVANLKPMMEDLTKGSSVGAKKKSMRAKYFRKHSSLSINHITTRIRSEDDRDWL